MEQQPHGVTGPDDEARAEAGPGPDGVGLDGIDLETLGTIDHPVLNALVEELRQRIEQPDGEALWGFDNDI